MLEQRLLLADNNYIELDAYLSEIGAKRIMLVCGKSIEKLKIGKYFASLTESVKAEGGLGIEVVRFSDFQPNPLYESVVAGVQVFKDKHCDAIIAVGGGSAMDVAKCIKLYSNMDENENYLKQQIVPNDIPFIAIPTTSGTGSEATRFAVIYYNGEKQSVSDYSCIPQAVLMDPSTIRTLPEYHKKATMLDALCHAIESFWSVNATEESREYSADAIRVITENKEAYLTNEDEGNTNMLKASNIAGKAINITQTTAGHAMCYKLTSLYGIAHGHAASICVAKLWPYMLEHMDKCIDPRGQEYLKKVMSGIARTMGCTDNHEAVSAYEKLLEELNLGSPVVKDEADYEKLKTSVNPVRLKNHPIKLDEEAIDMLYHQILG